MSNNSSDFLIDPFKLSEWQRDHRVSSVYASLIYVLTIYAGQKLMKNRPKFELRGALIVWNLILSVFSAFGMVYLANHFFYLLRDYGFHASVCFPTLTNSDPNCVLWGLLFIFSKFLELGDTVFIVLRKQPILFLHWYHHVTVLMFCSFASIHGNAPALVFALMNFTVHSFMYFYYALKAARVRIPRFISMILTTLQISQMMVGLYVAVHCYRVKSAGDYCGVPYSTLNAAFLMYFSYWVLFLRFFYDSYFRKQRQALVAPTKKET